MGRLQAADGRLAERGLKWAALGGADGRDTAGLLRKTGTEEKQRRKEEKRRERDEEKKTGKRKRRKKKESEREDGQALGDHISIRKGSSLRCGFHEFSIHVF